MSKMLVLALLAGAPLALASTQRGSLGAAERARLQTHGTAGLAELRAGAPAPRPSIALDERTALRSAQSRSADLGALRAGDLSLSDRDLRIILIAVAATIILIAIA